MGSVTDGQIILGVVQRSELTSTRGHLHFVWSDSAAVSLFSIVGDSFGQEQEGAGPRIEAVVGEDSVHLKVRAHDHVIS